MQFAHVCAYFTTMVPHFLVTGWHDGKHPCSQWVHFVCSTGESMATDGWFHVCHICIHLFMHVHGCCLCTSGDLEKHLLPRFVDCSCMYILLLYVHACIYTQWLCSLQSGGSISKWHSPVTLSVSDALCSWSGKQQNGELPEAGTVSGVVLIFPSWTLHVCYAYRDAVCCKSSCQHLTVLDQLSVSLVGLQATLGQSIYSKLASPRVMLHSLTDTGTPLRDWCQILSHNLWCGHVVWLRVNVVIEYRWCVTM